MSDCHFENGVDVVETDVLCPGNDITTFQLHGFKCGIAICYDAGFDEFIKLYGRAGMNHDIKMHPIIVHKLIKM